MNLNSIHIAAFSISLGLAFSAHAQERFITIGTGGVTGVYYPTGSAICRLVNNSTADNGLRCSVAATGGSVYNTRTIRKGELDFGVIQSDVQAAAIAGTGAFVEDGAYPDLRALFSIHPEPIHLMARADSGIKTVADLAGHRVNIGNPGSGQRELADTLMRYTHLSTKDFSLAAEITSAEQSSALCDGNIDAAVWAAGLPNGSTREATSTCDIKLIPLDGPDIDRLLADNPAYAPATIPGGMYSGNPDDVPSWGPRATLVTSAQTPDDEVYAVVKAVFDNFENFKRLHPAFANLNEKQMITSGLTAKLHPGAVRYYKERGWM
ncbi:C4-dicarboxylate ABC transporter substrate-binding protein [Pokkaliibacter plantistimulans]|uniref:C4-dicarboxylate ABC transporter substrate-binding protein n=1 Tax=Proteobacteria bacterium 228 TaxID=2083153 RepID=A0A2S5KS58_9PROT|nr:TAXI family TRAP transporter solute-binding subunit [Pokkaliibacter plantistimulans]PPC77553.1 C4-dicarboxylate ABC transporter substrate-binding protein [Pokkaliibacter plantistimulans]